MRGLHAQRAARAPRRQQQPHRPLQQGGAVLAGCGLQGLEHRQGCNTGSQAGRGVGAAVNLKSIPFNIFLGQAEHGTGEAKPDEGVAGERVTRPLVAGGAYPGEAVGPEQQACTCGDRHHRRPVGGAAPQELALEALQACACTKPCRCESIGTIYSLTHQRSMLWQGVCALPCSRQLAGCLGCGRWIPPPQGS